MFYLIDGYNLAMDSGLSRTLSGPGNPERARSRLLMWLAGRLDDAERARTTVVFDAKRHSVDKADSIEFGMRVLFAVDYPDADSMIEALIAKHSAPKFLTVVSSDQRLLTAALRRRALAVRSADWFEQIDNRPRLESPTPDSDEKLPIGEREKLISEFDTAEIQRLIDDENRIGP